MVDLQGALRAVKPLLLDEEWIPISELIAFIALAFQRGAHWANQVVILGIDNTLAPSLGGALSAPRVPLCRFPGASPKPRGPPGARSRLSAGKHPPGGTST
jgi:hypothetical protein